jgi:hypothetical protein
MNGSVGWMSDVGLVAVKGGLFQTRRASGSLDGWGTRRAGATAEDQAGPRAGEDDPEGTGRAPATRLRANVTTAMVRARHRAMTTAQATINRRRRRRLALISLRLSGCSSGVGAPACSSPAPPTDRVGSASVTASGVVLVRSKGTGVERGYLVPGEVVPPPLGVIRTLISP